MLQRSGLLMMNLCYTGKMQTNRSYWPVWAQWLRRWRLSALAAALLEAAGPLAYFGAQALYVGQPFLNSAVPDYHLKALAEMFEDAQELKAFAAFLREE